MTLETDVQVAKIPNKVTFGDNEQSGKKTSGHISKRTKTPLRKSHSLTVLKGEVACLSKRIPKTMKVSNDDVIISAPSPLSTSSSSDGRGRLIRRRLPILPKVDPGNKTSIVVLRDGLDRRRSNEEVLAHRNRLSLQYEFTSFQNDSASDESNVADSGIDNVSNTTNSDAVVGDSHTRDTRTCSKTASTRSIKNEASDGDTLTGSPARSTLNRSTGIKPPVRVVNYEILRPVPVRISSNGCPQVRTVLGNGQVFEDDTLRRKSTQETALKRHSSDVSKTLKEYLENDRKPIQRRTSLQAPLLVPMKQLTSSAVNNIEDSKDMDSAVRVYNLDNRNLPLSMKVSSNETDLTHQGKVVEPEPNNWEESYSKRSNASRTSHPIETLRSNCSVKLSSDTEHSQTEKSVSQHQCKGQLIMTTETETSKFSIGNHSDNRNGKVVPKCNSCILNGTGQLNVENSGDIHIYSKDTLKFHKNTTASIHVGRNIAEKEFGPVITRNEDHLNGAKSIRLDKECPLAISNGNVTFKGLDSALSIHFLLENFQLIPISLIQTHPGDNFGITFAKKMYSKEQLKSRSSPNEVLSPEVMAPTSMIGVFRPVTVGEVNPPLLGVVMVMHVTRGSTADVSGRVEAGDIIVEINCQNVIHAPISAVMNLLAVAGGQVDIVLARSITISKSERNICRLSGNSNGIHHSNGSIKQPFFVFNQNEILNTDSKRSERTGERTAKYDESRRQQNHRDQLMAIEKSSLALTQTRKTVSRHQCVNRIQLTESDDDISQEHFDPDFGWQKVSAV